MDINTILGEQILHLALVSNNEISGPNYVRLSRIATDNGFSDAEFKEYLENKNIRLRTNQPPLEPFRNTKFM